MLAFSAIVIYNNIVGEYSHKHSLSDIMKNTHTNTKKS